jgi:hypothetical protein
MTEESRFKVKGQINSLMIESESITFSELIQLVYPDRSTNIGMASGDAIKLLLQGVENK